MKAVVMLGAVALLPASAYAHHATAPVYDRGRIIEAEGDLIDVSWRNPHIRFTMRSIAADGAERVWDIETNSVSIVSRFGLTEGLVDTGTHVRVAGNPGRVGGDALWLTNMLLPNGQEILFGARIEPKWSGETIGADIRGAVTGNRELGIFRVWTSAGGGGALWKDSYPLTAAARAAQAAHDPVVDDPTANCAPKGMPYIMEQPYPMAIVDAGDVIELRLEEYDTVRRIAMSPEALAAAGPAGRLGRSVGRFEGETLVVETTDIDYAYFNATGIPQSPASRIEERFALNEDGSRLEYTMIVTDPATFTEPVTLGKAWEWRPGEQVRPYNCLQD